MEGQGKSLSSPLSHGAVIQAARAGVIIDPAPLPRTSTTLPTDVSQDLYEQRAMQEQAKLLERFKMLRQWQQQQQTHLMVQQQQQLELLKNQQEMVQQALMQQRLRQWGGTQTSSPPRSPQRAAKSPRKSPASSPSRASKPTSSIPKALAKASLELSAFQNVEAAIIENMSANIERNQSQISQEENGFDSEMEHPGSESVDDGVYPLPDTASETSDVDNRLANESQDHENGINDYDEEEHFRSVSDQAMTPTRSSPPHGHHLSIHLPDTQGIGDDHAPPSPDEYPTSPSPVMSPFTPTSPTHRKRANDEGKEDGESEDMDERPIQSQLGVGFKSFDELVELQMKSDKKEVPSSGTTTSENTTSRSRHTFLRRGEGIARFGMKPRKFKPRKPAGNEPSQKTDAGKKQVGKAEGGKAPPVTKKKSKKEEPPKVSRKVFSKQSKGKESQEFAFKKPFPALLKPQQGPGKNKLSTNPQLDLDTKPVPSPLHKEKIVSSPVERERIEFGAQVTKGHLRIPETQLSEDSRSGHDDTIEASFSRHKKIWEKKAKIEQEDLDEFEMLEAAADDNASFCSEASLVVNVMQRARNRKELMTLSPHVKQPPLSTLHSVDATEEEPPDKSRDTSPDYSRKGNTEIHMHSRPGMHRHLIQKETIEDDPFTKGRPISKVADVRDSFYSSDADSNSDDEEKSEDDGGRMDHFGRTDDVSNQERRIMRKVSKRTINDKNDREENDNLRHDGSEESDEEEEIEEDEDEEDGDFEIYKSKFNENRNNNNQHQFSLSEQERVGQEDSISRTNDGSNIVNGSHMISSRHVSSHMIPNGNVGNHVNSNSYHMTSNGHVIEEHSSDEFGEDFEGTPRKSMVPPETENHGEFEDEETWGDFTAHLSDTSDDDSIIAMAPDLKLPSSTKDEQAKSVKKRKTREKVAETEGYASPPPTSDLVARLFPKLRQPENKQKKEIEEKEKVFHSVAKQPAAEGSQARLLRDKLTQLENEIERFRKENLLLAKLREDREKGLEMMKKEMDDFQTQKEEELKRLKEFKDEEMKKIKKERKLFEQHQKTLRAMPDKRDRAEIEMLKDQVNELQNELKQREARWNASTKRLRDRTIALESENAELREEIRLLEQKRLASWKKDEHEKKPNLPQRQHSVPRPRPPALPVSHKVEHSNNNNINRKRPGSEEKAHYPEGENHYYRMDRKKTNSADDSDNEYIEHVVDTPKKEEEKIYESRIPLRRSRSPSDRQRLSIPKPSERTPSPVRTKPSSLSPSVQSSAQNTPTSESPMHQPHGSPHRTEHARPIHVSPTRGVSKPAESGGTGDYEEVIHTDGKVEHVQSDGSRILTFPNGTRKEISADGRTIISFFNGDMKQIMPDQRVIYYYSETKTTHTTYPDGLEILQFSNKQTEKHYPDGTKEITFPDQTIKYLYPNGGEESVFADGTVLRVEPSGRRVMEFPNGQREIHTEQYKKREYPDGTVKTVYPDGRQETRYSSGRLRIKDSAGNIILDKKC